MKFRTIIAVLMLSLIPIQCKGAQKSVYSWQPLMEGIEYTTYAFPISERERATIHAFRIDPKKHKLEVALAGDEVAGATARELAKRAGAMIAINGGFFTPEHRSIGLIVNDGKASNKLHNTSWWSVFQIKDGTPSIVKPSDYSGGEGVEMAIQCGPRLTIDGSIPKHKESVSKRSAIGITRDGKVVIAITEGYGLSMKEIAKRMGGRSWEGGLEAPNSMALDGGSSSQLYAKVGDFELSLAGLARVTNAVTVSKR